MIPGNEIETFMLSTWYTHFVHMNREHVLNWRITYLRLLDGDLLPPIQLWPKYVRRIFFQTAFPVGERQTFILYLFLIGNGLSPFIAVEWILSSFAISPWRRRKYLLRKRILQIKWIQNNIENNIEHWRYFWLYGKTYCVF